MGDQQNITQILAALAAARPGVQQGGFPGSLPAPTPPVDASGYGLPPPDNTGKFDLSGVAPVNSGLVNIQEAIAKARGFAAERGLSYNPDRGLARDDEPMRDSRSYRRSPSASRSPTRPRRDVFRDNYNPYRDERRGDKRAPIDRGYMRERSFSPRPTGRRPDAYSPPPTRRYGGDAPHSPTGRRGGDDNSEIMSIDSRLVGLIIGRAGETLRKVESDTGARVQFLDCPEPHTRLCRITGNRIARNDAKDEINRLVHENSTAARPGNILNEWPPRDSSGATSEEKFVQIMVPDRTVGLIIGRRGETIKDLQERSGCHVNIEDKNLNGLRPVNLTGPPRATEKAKGLIMEIVESDSNQHANAPPPREMRGGEMRGGHGPSDTGDKLTDSFFIPKDAVGMIIGKRGDAIKEMQAMTGCKVNILPSTGRDGEREVTLLGSRTAIDQAKRSILDKVEAAKNRAPGGPRRDEPPSDQYSSYQHQPYSPDPTTLSQQPRTQAAPAADSSDPYAQYGGYENYVAMWYAAMAQQQQQQQYQQGGQEAAAGTGHPRPPGLS